MLIFLILIFGLLLRVINLDQSFWLDEAAQVIESARPLAQQLAINGDFQPPLFHLLLHFWLRVSHTEVWVRLLPVLIGVATIFMTYKTALLITTKRIALLTALLLSIAPFHIWYSQEVRPYALSALLGMVTTYFLLKENLWGYVLSTAAFLYTMYLAPFLILSQGLFILLFRRRWMLSWLQAVGGAVLIFAPWIPSFLEQLSIGSSLQYSLPGWSEVVSTPLSKALPLVFTKFVLGRITFENKFLYAGISGILAFGYAICGLLALKKFPKRVMQIGLLLMFPLLTAYAASFFLPILAPQRVLFLLPFFYLLLALGIFSFGKKMVLLVALISLVSTYSMYQYVAHSQFQREYWREAVRFVEQQSSAHTYALFVFPDAFAPWLWYSSQTVPYIAAAPTFTVKESELNSLTPILLQADKLFYFHYLSGLTDPEKKTIKYISSLGFSEIKTYDFPGVGFITEYEKVVAYY